MYVKAIVTTVVAWFIGLFIDVNIDLGEPQGFMCLRVLLPIIVMGLCILSATKKNGNKKE